MHGGVMRYEIFYCNTPHGPLANNLSCVLLQTVPTVWVTQNRQLDYSKKLKTYSSVLELEGYLNRILNFSLFQSRVPPKVDLSWRLPELLYICCKFLRHPCNDSN